MCYLIHHGIVMTLNFCATKGLDMYFHSAPQVVVRGERISVSSSETQSSVAFSQACPADTGSYTIIVRNRQGTGQHTVSLNVIGKGSLFML